MLHCFKKSVTFLIIIFLILGFFSTLVYGQRKTIKILGVSVQGNLNTEAEIIKMTAGLIENKEVTGDQIQNSIKQLWGLGIFSDVQLYLDREVGDGVFLLLKLKEYTRRES